MLSRSLKCSQCGQRAPFEARRMRPPRPPPQLPPRPSFVERVEIPDDLARLLWREHG